MDYDFLFHLLVAFLVGRASKLKFYIGIDKEKYDAADAAVLLKEAT